MFATTLELPLTVTSKSDIVEAACSPEWVNLFLKFASVSLAVAFKDPIYSFLKLGGAEKAEAVVPVPICSSIIIPSIQTFELLLLTLVNTRRPEVPVSELRSKTTVFLSQVPEVPLVVTDSPGEDPPSESKFMVTTILASSPLIQALTIHCFPEGRLKL